MSTIISATAITKQYNVTRKLEGYSSKKEVSTRKTVLEGITINIDSGKIIGILGVEGSGKSVLGNILAGKETPTRGTVTKSGQVALIKEQHSLIESDTGLQNIKRIGKARGLSDREIEMVTFAIVEYAHAEEIIHLPVHTYSNKSKMLLEFAISIHCDPEVLILDGSLPKEHEKYYSSYTNTIRDWKKQGKSILIMGNVVSELQNLPDEVIWLHNGRLIQQGSYEEVTSAFNQFLQKRNNCHTKEELEAFDEEIKMQAFVDERTIQEQDTLLPIQETVTKNSKKGVAIAGGVLAVALLGVGIYSMGDFGKDAKSEPKKETVAKQPETETPTETNKEEGSNKKPKEETATPTIDEKMYAYINVSLGIVREKPSKTADQKATIAFGDHAEILEKKSVGDDVWYQLQLSDGKKGWMHSSIASAFTKEDLKSVAISNEKVKELVDGFGYKTTFDKAISMFGENSTMMKKKISQDIEHKKNTDRGESWYTQSYQYLFSNDKLVEFYYRKPDVTKQELVEKLGKPILQEKETGMYGYVSEDYLVRVYFKKSKAINLSITKL